MIQGYTGQIDMWANRVAFEPTFLERLDHLFATGDCPDAVVVMVDAWTSFGGSQFLDSTSTGPYMTYLCDEVVAFVDERYPTAPHRDHRGLTGKSSGGYGAMVVPMLRPDVFGALASHCGDALFEVCYADFRVAARKLRDDFDGSYEVFFERARRSRPRRLRPLRRAAGGLRLRRRLLARPRAAGQGAAAVRARHGPDDRRRLGAVARPGTRSGSRRPTPTRCAR